MRQTTLAFAIGLFSACLAFGQTISGSIAGGVVDPQHAAVPNAAVTATEQEQKFTLTTKTDDAGRFVFTQLPPGTYTITVESPGFKKFDRSGIKLNANDKLALGEIAMEVGAISEQVEVSGTLVTLQTESAERSTALISTQMENIASNGRSYLDLVKLVPGAVSTANFATGTPGGLANISVNGVRTNSNQLTLNGISNVDTGSNGAANASISLDSVQELKILTGVYQAEYGRSMGAQINVVSKTGSSSSTAADTGITATTV